MFEKNRSLVGILVEVSFIEPRLMHRELFYFDGNDLAAICTGGGYIGKGGNMRTGCIAKSIL